MLLTTVNTAVFAPMPSASVRMAITVKPGDLRSMRSANLASCINVPINPPCHAQRTIRANAAGFSCSLVPQCLDWIYAGGAHRRHHARRNRHGYQDQRDASKRERLRGRNAVEQTRLQA